MAEAAKAPPARRPRFRRAADAPPFRLTNGDVDILGLLARHRFLRSTHIAALVGRSVDRVNDRLLRLFHAGYVDRPRAQLDYYPTSGSSPFIYALADLGARLLAEHDRGSLLDAEWSRKNCQVGRPFIEHQIEIMDFYVSLQLAVRNHAGLSLLGADDLAAQCPVQIPDRRNSFALRVQLSQNGTVHDIGVVPDLVFGIKYSDGSRRCFLVEVDRGMMPVTRRDIRQTSFTRKMRVYLAAHAARLHEQHFGWKTFRVLAVTNDRERLRSMVKSCRALSGSMVPGPRLFLFSLSSELYASNPLAYFWHDGGGYDVQLI